MSKVKGVQRFPGNGHPYYRHAIIAKVSPIKETLITVCPNGKESIRNGCLTLPAFEILILHFVLWRWLQKACHIGSLNNIFVDLELFDTGTSSYSNSDGFLPCLLKIWGGRTVCLSLASRCSEALNGSKIPHRETGLWTWLWLIQDI